MPIRFVVLLLSMLCLTVQAAGPADTARLQQLAENSYWLALGHYEQQSFARWRSHVDDAGFFMSPEGSRSPLAELNATLAALYDHPAQANQHAQCRFPARTRWLREQLQLTDLPAVNCPEFDTWYADIDPHSVVLIFPDAYLNSPSSMFGHTLLRIDSADHQGSGTALLSYALNFGAMIEGADNSILYAWKGLAGGYPGQFALLPYREKIGEYSRLENRDLWEYQLDLTPTETGRMIEHVWELRQVQFDYYFFDENCSYRLLELLDIARPGLQLIDQFPLTTIPVDSVRAVRNAGLIESTHYRPSREKELLARVSLLEPKEVNLAQSLAADTQVLEQADFTQLAAPRQALVQETAYRFVRYQASGQERETQSANRSYRLLQAINQNPPPPLALPMPTLPEQGHDSRTWQIAAGEQDGKPYAEYALRMAYHDLNDNLTGFPLGAQIELGQLRVRQYQGNHWRLEQLGLVNIRSLTPRTQLLKPWSWQVATGLERVPAADEAQQLVGHLNGGGGFTWPLGDHLIGYSLATLRLEHNAGHSALLSPAAGFDAGLLWRNPLGNLLLEAQADYFHQGEVRRRMGLTQQLEVSRSVGVRLSAERAFSNYRSPQNELSLQLRWYYY